MSCQTAASKSWDLFHIDLKTAFLQGQSYDVNRDVVCQLPPEAGHPPHVAARLKKPACGMNDAPRRWWNVLDKALRTCGMIPTRADRCCYVLYSIQSRERARKHWGQRAVAQQNDAKDAFTKSSEQSEGKSVAGIINLFVDYLFGTGGNEMEQRVLNRHRQDFHVGSEEWNDVTFTGQRILWTQDSQNGPFIEVSQDKAIDELEEIPVERNTKEDLHCTRAMHTMYRSLLRQINWLQSSSNAVTKFPDVLR